MNIENANTVDIVGCRNVLEPHLFAGLVDRKFRTKTVRAVTLLTHNRFDLAALLFLEMRNFQNSFSEEIYREHIRAFSLGKFSEPGNDNKNSFSKFLYIFESIFRNIESKGFRSNLSLIPLSKTGSIVNGAHRVASAIYLNKTVDCVGLDSQSHDYGYKFFYTLKCSQCDLRYGCNEFVEYAEGIHVLWFGQLLWDSMIN